MKNLEKTNIVDIMALTPLQEGMLFYHLKEHGKDFYHVQLNLEISGEIDIKCFEKAWNTVIEINEILRTVFRWDKVEKPIQIILKEHKLHPDFYDFSSLGTGEKEKRVQQVKNRDREETFDHPGAFPGDFVQIGEPPVCYDYQ